LADRLLIAARVGPNPDIDILATRALFDATAGQIESRGWVLEDAP
jgi:hypothetical protein